MQFTIKELRETVRNKLKVRLEENAVVQKLETSRKIDEIMASANEAVNKIQVGVLKVLGLADAELSPEQEKIISQTLEDIKQSNKRIIQNAVSTLLSIEIAKQEGQTGANTRSTSGKSGTSVPTVSTKGFPAPDTSAIPTIREKKNHPTK